ncbi:MAG: hypothetical protein R2713_07880 [Ilumatobacteraceae bacterium]
MLLALDGDRSFEPVPYLQRRLEAFDAEIAAGVWSADADPLALTLLWDVILDGYFTMRRARGTDRRRDAGPRRAGVRHGRATLRSGAERHRPVALTPSAGEKAPGWIVAIRYYLAICPEVGMDGVRVRNNGSG